MQPRLSRRHETGMTLFEVGVVIAIVMVVGLILIPTLAFAKRKAMQINCANYIKAYDCAFRIWAGDNGDLYPMGISVTNGGSMELVETGNVLLTFLVMSNELSTPKVIICPADTDRTWATNFGSLANSNISYFVGVDATNEANPRLFLSGDCNFEINGKPVKPGLFASWTNDPAAWSATRHGRRGNLGFADGSVQSATAAELRGYLKHTGRATNRLAIP